MLSLPGEHEPAYPGLTLPTPTLKSMARNDATGEYVLFTYGMKTRLCKPMGIPTKYCGAQTYRSSDSGRSWQLVANTTLPPPIKDDLNLIYNKGRYVDMQIFSQNGTANKSAPVYGKYCDNTGCTRRVVTAKTSSDGAVWGQNLGVRTADDDGTDPPGLQFYRIRPFFLGDSGRLAAHALLYVPSPWLGRLHATSHLTMMAK